LTRDRRGRPGPPAGRRRAARGFDPAYPIDSLESFEPEVTRVFAKPLRAY
jgi:hypothetical protein